MLLPLNDIYLDFIPANLPALPARTACQLRLASAQILGRQALEDERPGSTSQPLD